jgi:carbon-monoxide dehydrogenase medium subunit
MKPAPFAYCDPHSLREVIEALGERGTDAKLLAGGQSLMPVLNMRLSRTELLIDLNKVDELEFVDGSTGRLHIGALARHDTLLKSAEVAGACPLVAKSIPLIGHTAIRYRGTVGGSLVHADPSAELPAVMTALEAEFVVAGHGGSRTVPAGDFFVTFFTTAIEPDEVLTEIVLDRQEQRSGNSVVELARRHGDFALAGIVATVTRDGEQIASARLCAFGVDEVPRRLAEVEQLVTGEEPSAELLSDAGNLATTLVEPESDMHASAEYRRNMTGVLVRRALREAVEDAAK